MSRAVSDKPDEYDTGVATDSFIASDPFFQAESTDGPGDSKSTLMDARPVQTIQTVPVDYHVPPSVQVEDKDKDKEKGEEQPGNANNSGQKLDSEHILDAASTTSSGAVQSQSEEDTSVLLSDTQNSSEDQDYLSDGMDIRRVKVYELIDSRWTDRGTAFCSGDFDATSQEARLTARSETNPSEIILSCCIRSTIIYHRQQATLIVWTETDGTDFALSFQDVEGCTEVWEFILDVQRHISGRDDSVPSSPLIGPHPSITTQQIIQSGRLPNPQMGIIGEIDKAIKMLGRTPAAKERICKYIVQEDYIKAMLDVFVAAEDLEDVDTLHALCSCMQTILMLNDHNMYEHVLNDELWLGVVGMLEYDPEFPSFKANYRDFLSQDSKFLQPVMIQDDSVQKKIHQTYRLQYMKDVVLARILDDSTFNVLNSCIIFNQIDIINHIQSDERFLRDAVSIFTDKNNAEPADGKDTYTKLPEATSSNGTINSEERDARRREVILLVQQLCIMGKNVQLPARVALFRTLVDRGVLFAVQWALSQPEKQLICVGGEILASMLDHDTMGIRTHVLAQSAMQSTSSTPSPEFTMKSFPPQSNLFNETLLHLLCRMLASTPDLALQNQLSDSLRALLEVPQTDSPGEAHHLLPTKIMPRPKDDPATERFLDNFYKNSADVLFRPMLYEVPDYKELREPKYEVSREKANLYLYLCDLLCAFAVQHSFRSHFFLLSSNIAFHIATLLSVRDKHLCLASLRFFRMCLKLNNRNLFNHLIKMDVIGPIIQLTQRESKRDNLLNSTCLEFFEHMRKENLKELIHHAITKYEVEIRRLAQSAITSPTFEGLLRRWEMNSEPPPEIVKDDSLNANSRMWNNGRALEAEEEDYFNKDDDEDEKSFNRSRNDSSIDTHRRKRQRIDLGGFSIGTSGPPSPSIQQTSTFSKASPLSSLMDYNEEDDTFASSEPNENMKTSSLEDRSMAVPATPVLAHREIEVTQGAESKTSEPAMHPNLTDSLALPGESSRLGEKRRREDEEDDELLEKLMSKNRRSSLHSTGTETAQLLAKAAPLRTGEDGPKKLKLRFGPVSKTLVARPSSISKEDDDEGG